MGYIRAFYFSQKNFRGILQRMEYTTEPLNAAFVEAQKKKLEEERTRLQSELSRIAEKDAVGDDYHAQVEQIGRAPDENVVEEEQYEAARSVEQSLEVQLRDVNNALQRISDGTYGACPKCGERIDQKRLEALPSAQTCLKHAG
jgi:RNA polymerase-binding transcription factor DksA